MKFIYFAKRLVNVEHLARIGKVIAETGDRYYIEAKLGDTLLREIFDEQEAMGERFKIIAKQLGV